MYRNYKNTTIGGSLEGIVNIGNLLFHKERNKWNLYAGLGIGVLSIDTKVNNQKGGAIINWESLNLNADDKYADNVQKIKDAMDDDYETAVENERGVGGFADNGKIAVQVPISIGISRKINKRLNIGIEHKFIWADYDSWDGFVYRSAQDQSNDSDKGQSYQH